MMNESDDDVFMVEIEGVGLANEVRTDLSSLLLSSLSS